MRSYVHILSFCHEKNWSPTRRIALSVVVMCRHNHRKEMCICKLSAALNRTWRYNPIIVFILVPLFTAELPPPSSSSSLPANGSIWGQQIPESHIAHLFHFVPMKRAHSVPSGGGLYWSYTNLRHAQASSLSGRAFRHWATIDQLWPPIMITV